MNEGQTIETKGEAVFVRVRVQPRASREALLGEAEGRLRIALTAPPAEGEANEALVAFLAKKLGIAKREVRLASGAHSREKAIEIKGITESEVRMKLLAAGQD